MCGIAGILRHDGQPVRTDVLAAMAARLRHRGPDDEGSFADGPLGLAHRRLSIIDPSPGARQPMATEDGRRRVMFNGEVYNFEAVRAQLAGLGHAFRTRSDTEVILRGHLQWGDDVLARLNGMFALALWDADERRLLLARDRLGEKPLYYFADETQLCFASSIEALLSVPGVPREPDYRALDQFLTYQYVPGPRTGFARVQTLPPGHVLSVSPGSKPRVEAYWELPRPDGRAGDDVEALARELRARLEAAVRLRMVADVPLGAFLSGGLDSSAVVACMAAQSARPVRTYSIGFGEPAYDERPYARVVAQRLGTEHHELVVEPSCADVLPRLVRHYGVPFGDASAIPTFALAEFARTGVTVALTGDGGDETFAGYPKYVLHDRLAFVDRLPPLVRRGAGAVAARLPEARAGWRPYRLGRRWLSEVPLPPWVRYGESVAYLGTAERERLYTPELKQALGPREDYTLIEREFHRAGAARFADAQLNVDLATYLPDDLLVKADVATMAHGLEARAPFLDHTLVEFAATVPLGLKIRHGHGKYLLRRAFADVLPPVVLARDKQGFGVPLDGWLKHELAPLVEEVVLGERLARRGWLDPAGLRTLVDEHLSGRRRHEGRIWLVLMLELWARTWLDALPGDLPAGAVACSTGRA